MVSKEDIQQILDEIMKEIAVLVTEVRSLAVEVGNYVQTSKELYEKGREAAISVLELRKELPKIRAEVQKTARRLKEGMFMQYILRAKMTHPEVIEIMKNLSKKQTVVLDEKKRNLIREILRGKIDASKFAVKKLRGEIND